MDRAVGVEFVAFANTFKMEFCILASHDSYFEEHLSLLSRQDDKQFSSFVYWVVTATFMPRSTA